jgi:Outer membrane protein beta-barrel domain
MKYYRYFILLFLINHCTLVSYSQKITTGISSGVNFSDIHGQETGGKWKSKPGPVQGFYLGYSFNKSIGIQTGIDFSAIYYEHRSTSYPGKQYPIPLEVDYFGPAFYYSNDDKMDFRFLRVPLLFTVSVPGTMQFNMRAGLFFSFLQDYSLNTYYYYSSMGLIRPKKKDFGYIFSSGFSYPLNDKFRATLNGAYLTGRKEFLENSNYRHGSSEFTLGFEYTGFLKNKNTPVTSPNTPDSSLGKITVRIVAGADLSWNSHTGAGKKYSPAFGPSFGFLIDFPLNKKTSFKTGFSFERKGYSLNDSSSSFFEYLKNPNLIYNVDSRVQIDYAIIPVLLSTRAGKSDRIFLSTGPWLGLKLNARNVGVAYDETRSGSGYTLRETVIYDDLEKLIKNYDLGWIFGFGASLPVVKNYKVDLSVQYSIGFRDVYNNPGTGTSQSEYPTHSIKNRTISLLLGFMIPSTDR